MVFLLFVILFILCFSTPTLPLVDAKSNIEVSICETVEIREKIASDEQKTVPKPDEILSDEKNHPNKHIRKRIPKPEKEKDVTLFRFIPFSKKQLRKFDRYNMPTIKPDSSAYPMITIKPRGNVDYTIIEINPLKEANSGRTPFHPINPKPENSRRCFPQQKNQEK
ncbi:MAG: hypothetical protein C4527_08570 [Candidatus Omnitrophota bacterium]|nr:MAG: hypothetical protein C4527_08570 [Candidatus Omnitrophota bacterium]